MRRNIKTNKDKQFFKNRTTLSTSKFPSQSYGQFDFFQNIQQQQSSIYMLLDDLYPFYKQNSVTTIILILTLCVQFFKLFVFQSPQSDLFKVSIFTQLVQTFVYANFMLIYGAYIESRHRGWFLTLYAICQICGYLTAIVYSWSINLHNFHLLTTTFSLYYLILNQHRFDSKVKISLNLSNINQVLSKLSMKIQNWLNTSKNIEAAKSQNSGLNRQNKTMPIQTVPDIFQFQSFSSQKQLRSAYSINQNRAGLSNYKNNNLGEYLGRINNNSDLGNDDSFNYDSFFKFQQNLGSQKKSNRKNQLSDVRRDKISRNIDYSFQFRQQETQNHNDLNTIDEDFILRQKQSNKKELIKIYKCIIFTFLVYSATTKLEFVTFVVSSVCIMFIVQVMLNSKLKTLKIACLLGLLLFFIAFIV